jgi:hypothetical protein
MILNTIQSEIDREIVTSVEEDQQPDEPNRELNQEILTANAMGRAPIPSWTSWIPWSLNCPRMWIIIPITTAARFACSFPTVKPGSTGTGRAPEHHIEQHHRSGGILSGTTIKVRPRDDYGQYQWGVGGGLPWAFGMNISLHTSRVSTNWPSPSWMK